jgi:hypothetical protein
MTATADPDAGAHGDAERREAPRIGILGTLRADVLFPQRLDITDISAAGLQAASSFPFQLDTVYEFRLTLEHMVVVVKGRVVHSAVREIDPHGVEYRTGVDFVDVAEGTRAALDTFARRLVEQRNARTHT